MKMIRNIAIATLVTSSLLLGAWKVAYNEVEIGDMIPMMQIEMEDISGNSYHLRELHEMHGLLVIFSCNTCPFVLQWEDRYNELYDLCAANDIGMVLVNSNEAKRDGDDSMEEMKQHAKAEGYKMPYVVDKDHVVADAFGAKTTPHVFLFDGNAQLVYRGLIDDNGKDKNEVSEPYLKNAINQVLAGKTPDPAQTKSIGCSIKRVSK